MQAQELEIDFQHFIEYFPELELPVHLDDEVHHTFSLENEPLPSLAIEQYLLPIEEDTDELTEFIPCFRVPETYDFHAIIYWKAAIMNYQYVLATFEKSGELIDKRVIAGTFSDGTSVIKSVATIEEDWMILTMTGKMSSHEELYDATSSKMLEMELLPDGTITAQQERGA
jgi:hypothetical protein